MVWPFRKKKILHSHDSFEMALRLLDVALEQLALCWKNRRANISENDFRTLEKIRDGFHRGYFRTFRIERDLRARMEDKGEGLQTAKWPDYRQANDLE